MVPHRAVGGVALPRAGHRHAAGGVGALVVGFRELPAKPASHVDDEVLLRSEVLILRSTGTELISHHREAYQCVHKTTQSYGTKRAEYFMIWQEVARKYLDTNYYVSKANKYGMIL